MKMWPTMAALPTMARASSHHQRRCPSGSRTAGYSSYTSTSANSRCVPRKIRASGGDIATAHMGYSDMAIATVPPDRDHVGQVGDHRLDHGVDRVDRQRTGGEQAATIGAE